jgi:hypothetical protein
MRDRLMIVAGKVEFNEDVDEASSSMIDAALKPSTSMESWNVNNVYFMLAFV